jgi:glutamyl-tRNA reductase
MPVLALGVSYRRAPVELLERLAFADEHRSKDYRRLLDAEEISEGVILSTCNRVEVYARVESYHAGFQGLKRFLSEAREVSFEAFAEPLYSHYETHAAEHLFGVAAGIDSVVVGEPQILSQVRQAFRTAEEEGAAGPLLSALFRGAIRTGRRVRAETEVASSPAGFVQAGLDLAGDALGSVEGVPALVVGAGAMGSIAVGALRARGAGPITVISRSAARARRLARRGGLDHARWEELPAALSEAGLVVSSTAATGTVIGVDAVRWARSSEPPRPRFILDLAVPRDVDPAVASLPGVTVADLDAVSARVAASRPERGSEIDAVRRIVAEEVHRLERWRTAGRLAPLIQALQAQGDTAVAAELRRLAPRMAAMSQRDAEAAEALARGAMAKLLHGPIARLKAASGPSPEDGPAKVLAELFGIDFPPKDRSS